MAVGLAVLAMASCARFHPVIPLRAQMDDVELELSSVRRPDILPIEFTLRSRSTSPHAIGHAWLTVATRDPCTDGAEADRLTVDGSSAHPLPLPAGEHELVARFDRAGGENTLDLVLDVRLDEEGDPRCVRTPVISQVIALEPAKRPFIAAAFALDAVTNLSGLQGAIGAQVGAAGWAGPILVTGLGGIASVNCAEAVCGKDDNKMLRSGWGVPFSLDARYPLRSFSGGLADSVLSVGVRYSYLYLQLPDPAGKRRFDVHGAQVLLGWALTSRAPSPYRHAERGPSMEMTLPIGVMIDPDASSGAVKFALGVGWRFFFPL